MPYDVIRQYNKYAGENKSQIQKALTSAAGVGEALIPQHLEQVITNALPRLSPTVAMLTQKFDNQKLHEFNRLTALPGIGGAMGESATTPTYNPLFQRASVTLKIVRRKGATTDFLRDSSKKNIDAAAANMEACVLQHVYDLEHYTMYGNAGSNTYEYSGWDTFITTNRFNKAVGGVVPATLTEFDNLIDENLERQGEKHNKAFIMSPKMLSKVSSILTNVRLNQGLVGELTKVNIDGGWRLNAYRDIPIIMSSNCRPKSMMGTVTPATGTGGGGAIPDATTRYFRVAAININGETLACTEINQLTGSGGGNDNYITLSWTALPTAYKYKIYVGSVTNVLYLRHVIPGFTYSGSGTITGSISNTINTTKIVTSDANGNVNTVRFNADPNTAGTEVATGLQSDVPLIGSVDGLGNPINPPETVWFIDLDEFQGMGRLAYTNEGGSRFNGLVTIEDLAKTDDFLPFMIKSYCAIADSFEATSSIVRGLKCA